MACSNEIPKSSFECLYIRPSTIIVEVKPYVYELVKGKRKRVSPIVVKDGKIVEIKERGIVRRWK